VINEDCKISISSKIIKEKVIISYDLREINLGFSKKLPKKVGMKN
jgi:hypothetical protein